MTTTTTTTTKRKLPPRPPPPSLLSLLFVFGAAVLLFVHVAAAAAFGADHRQYPHHSSRRRRRRPPRGGPIEQGNGRWQQEQPRRDTAVLLSDGTSPLLQWIPRSHRCRRDLFRHLAASAAAGASVANAADDASVQQQQQHDEEQQPRMVLKQKPSAPIAALLPAVQQRLLLERCLALLEEETRSSSGGSGNDDTARKLRSVLLELDDAGGGRGAVTFELKRHPPDRYLGGGVVRAAMDLCASNLSYGADPDYAVTDKRWKKSYIRSNGKLPDARQVVEADLNLRELYRNQVQLKVDDASAELYADSIRASNGLGVVDYDELRNLLREAAEAFDLWLDLVDEGDVGNAVQAALEGQRARIYDSYYAGFIPPPSARAAK